MTAPSPAPAHEAHIIVDSDAFDELEAALTNPAEPTESIKEAAKLMRKLYPSPAPAQKTELVPVAWRCFHCDETFTSEYDARLHFGADETATPACQIKGSDRGLLGALREAERDAADAWHAVLSEATDAAKAVFSQNSRHQRQMRALEESAYEKGLADAKAYPEELYGPDAAAALSEERKRADAAEIERDRERKRFKDMLNAEHTLSDAYLRLRSIIPRAFDTPHSPTAEQVWETVEGAAKALLARAEAAEAQAAEERKRADAAEAENFVLAANQCEGPMIGDEHGHFSCAKVEALTAERDLAWHKLAAAEKIHRSINGTLQALFGDTNGQIIARAVAAEVRADAAETEIEGAIKAGRFFHDQSDHFGEIAEKALERAYAAEARVDDLARVAS